MRSFIILAALTVAVSAQAVEYFNVNFESAQGYSTGTLAGQGVFSASSNTSFAVTASPTTGQAATWNGGSFGFAWADLPDGGYTGAQTLWASVDVWLDGASANTDRYYGIAMFTDGDAFGVTLNSSGAVSAGYLYANVEGGNVVGNISNPTGRWVTLGVGYDIGSTSASIYFDGQLTTVGDIFEGTTIFDADLMSDYSASSASSSVAYWDNYRVGNAAPVPEPASMAALGLGALAMIRRRKAAKK